MDIEALISGKTIILELEKLTRPHINLPFSSFPFVLRPNEHEIMSLFFGVFMVNEIDLGERESGSQGR